jgi:ABC-2 type transport system permease protein
VKLAFVHARLLTLELVRYPAFLVPTLAFPALFFLFFAASARGAAATLAMCSFAAFATIGVAFFQFGVGIANERASPWEAYLRTLPAPPVARIGSRLLSAAVFAAAAAVLLVAVALATTDATLAPTRWLELAAVLALGLVPFALFGIALGYWATPRGALPLANLIYLGLAYGGGLWVRPQRLPAAVAAVAPYLPTGRLQHALAGVVRGSPWSARDWLPLAAFSVLAAAAACAGYRHDEGARFR